MKKNKIIYFFENHKKIILFLLGLISSLGFAPLHLFPITIFSYVFLICFFAYNNEKNKKIILYSYVYSLGMNIGTFYWIGISFKTANAGGYLVGAIAVLILSFFLSIFLAISFFLLFKSSKNYKNMHFGFVFIVIFTIFDWIKGNILWGFPWSSISTLWTFSSMSLYPFSIFGVWGYSLITYGLIISFYFFTFNYKKGFIFSSPFIISIVALPYILNMEKESFDTISLRIVQPNIKQEDKWNLDKLEKNYQQLTSLITLPGYQKIDLLVLPETAINFNIKKLDEKKNIRNFGLEHINNSILGAVRIENKNNDINVFNSMYFIKLNDKKKLYHDKLKLVPFGEFIPFRNIFSLDKLTQGQTDFTPGKELKLFEFSEQINILPLICYEVLFPNLVVKLKNKYNLIVNITNDAWYKKSSGPYQHFSHSKIRAVMEGLILIRSANTGVSGIINSKGIVLSKLALDEEGIIDYKLNINSIKTVYNKYGENLFYLILLTLLTLICIPFFYDKLKKLLKNNL